MASNDTEDALTEIGAFPRENAEGDELFFRRRFPYRARLLGGHQISGRVTDTTSESRVLSLPQRRQAWNLSFSIGPGNGPVWQR